MPGDLGGPLGPCTPLGGPLGPWGRSLGSARFRITSVTTVVVAVVLAATAVAVVLGQRRALTDAVDARVRQRAGDVVALLDGGTVPAALNVGERDGELVQLVTPGGDVVAAGTNLHGAPPVAGPPPRGERQELRTVVGLAVDREPFRLLSRSVDAAGKRYVLHVGEDLDDVGESVSALVASLAVVFPVVLGVVAVIVWLVVGRALRPVEEIRAEVADIGGAEPDRRVPDPGTDDEIGRLARTMNAMLDRVADARRRQERFAADAAHELRSPLTAMRSELEVDLAHPGGDPVATCGSALEEVVRMQRLVEDLLRLARSDAGGEDVAAHEDVDLDEIVLGEADAVRSRGGLTVDTRGVSGAQVRGDAEHLRRAVRNVLDNAARHAASRVSLSLIETEGGVELAVADDGPGVPAGAHDLVFERFARADEARDRDGGGAGLGLAIARDVVTRHGGTIALDPSANGGARFVIRLPLARPGGPA